MSVKILARLKDGPVTRRTVHVFEAQEPQEGTVTSYCLRIIAVDSLEVVEVGVGIPCVSCLMVAPVDTAGQVTSSNTALGQCDPVLAESRLEGQP